MTFRTESTLAGYARTAVDLKLRMHDYLTSSSGHGYVGAFFPTELADGTPMTPAAQDALRVMITTPWQHGEAYVLAPAMTAIVAAAADALDITGEVLPRDVAPAEHGVLYLPEPVYRRAPDGHVTSIGAITWALFTSPSGAAWAICGWADRDDPHDPEAARNRALLAGTRIERTALGPYVLSDFDTVPIGEPLQPAHTGEDPGAARDWEPAPDGRYCIDGLGASAKPCTALAYAFWRIQEQPLATVAAPPVDRSTKRRAARGSIVHDTRVVMLRRASLLTPPPDGDAKWHYSVRFVVRGHWRRLTHDDGTPYRIWINAHIKGPDGAPLLGGEKVAVLAR